jgi:hypothetical protein
MSFSPLKSVYLLASLTVAWVAAVPASAAGPGAGSCGGARYKSGLFAPKLNQLDKRVKDLCKQEKAAAKRLNSLFASCKDGGHGDYVKSLVKRGDELCEKGQRSVKETVQLCQEYDTGVASSKAGLASATAGTNNQSAAFSQRSGALKNASSQMSSVAGSAGAVSNRLKRFLPAAKDGQSGSTDPEIKKLMDNYKAYAKASPSTKGASCRQLVQGMEQMSTLVQQNIMPNLRVLQEGVAGINSNAASSASQTASAAFSDGQTAAKLKESARSAPLNQANPRAPASGISGNVPAINKAPVSPAAAKRARDAEILNSFLSTGP